MSGPVIIRLQNLPLEARSIDIRRFFDGLIIPDGGVHIIGGERGDAFIAFQSDEDARQAMLRDNYELCNSKIRLFLSSKSEMQNTIAAARNTTTAAPLATSSSTNLLNFQQQTAPKTQNGTELLSSLTKLISGGGSSSTQSSTTATTLNSLLPSSSSNSLLNRNEPPKQTQQQQSKPAQSNINIDQILGLLTQIKDNSALTTLTASLPSILNTSTTSNTTNNKPTNIQENEDSNDGQNNYNRFNNNNNNNNRNMNNNSNSLMSKQFNKPFLSGNKRKFDEDSQDNDRKMMRQNYSNNNMNQIQGTSQPRSNQLDPIILVKNFMKNASYKDIRTFLQGIQIEHDGIRILTDANGNRNGTAFVKLMTITDLKKALCRNGQFYQENQIEVSQSNEVDFNDPNFVVPTIKSSRYNSNQTNSKFNNNNNSNMNNNSKYQQNEPIDSSQGFFLKIFGLPADFDETELKNMFNNVKFTKIITSVPTPITTTITNQDGTTEQTTIMKAKKLCQVETKLDMERALTRQNERVGKGKIQVFQISKSDYDREMAYIGHNMPSLLNKDGSGSPSSNSNQDMDHQHNEDNEEEQESTSAYVPIEQSDELYLFMTGVPFSARELDVRSFFTNLNVTEINLLLDGQTLKPTGECCCQFASRQDRDKALEKDNQLFRNRVVKVKSITVDEYQKYSQQHSDNKQKLLSNRRNNVNEDGDENNRYNNNQNKFNNNKFQNNNNNNNKFGNGNGNNNFMNKRNNFNSNGFQNNNNNNNNNNNGNIKRFKKNFNDDEEQSITLVDLPPLPPELQKHRNSLVLLSNVPPKASREDILEMFKSFSPLEHTLKIRQDDNGNPTGDAIVACKSSEEANRACRSLHGADFMGKNIKASLVTP